MLNRVVGGGGKHLSHKFTVWHGQLQAVQVSMGAEQVPCIVAQQPSLFKWNIRLQLLDN